MHKEAKGLVNLLDIVNLIDIEKTIENSFQSIPKMLVLNDNYVISITIICS